MHNPFLGSPGMLPPDNPPGKKKDKKKGKKK